jgi:hypothetical protein
MGIFKGSNKHCIAQMQNNLLCPAKMLRKKLRSKLSIFSSGRTFLGKGKLFLVEK